MSILRIEGVTKKFGDVVAVDNVTLSLNQPLENCVFHAPVVDA